MRIIVCVLSMVTLAAVCFAQAVSDSTGIVGSQIVDVIGKFIGNNVVALSIYTAIVWLIGIGIRMLLKMLPVSMQGICGKIVWKLAAALFGSEVILENNKDREYLKQELSKKYPLLRIDIKNRNGV